MEFNGIEDLIEDIRHGKMVILMDDEDRENEGDLIMAASLVRPEDVNFMAKHARGLICLTLTSERCEQLKLPLMVSDNSAQYGTNFTLSIEAAEGVTTGISAADRATTIQRAVAANARPEDIVQPGHIFPLRARPGGVLRRAGHTEAGCDLARLAGVEAAAVIVEIMNDDGSMARRPDLEKFAELHQMKMGTIADLIHYRTVHEQSIERVRTEPFSTEFGDFTLVQFRDLVDDQQHIALIKGDLDGDEIPYVRVHVADPLRDLLRAKKEQGSGWCLPKVMRFLGKSEGPGVVVLLGSSFDAHPVQDTIERYYSQTKSSANMAGSTNNKEGTSVYRSIGTGSQILQDLGVHKMRLLSAPKRYNAISGFSLEIVEYIECPDD